MPETRIANITGLIDDGAGTMLFDGSSGYLQTVLPVIPESTNLYAVMNPNGTTSTRNMGNTVTEAQIPYANSLERITVRAKMLGETQPDPEHPEWTVFNTMISFVGIDHNQISTADYAMTPITVSVKDGQVILTTDPTKIGREMIPYSISTPGTVSTSKPLTDNLSVGYDNSKLTEETILEYSREGYVYKSTGQPMVKIADNLFVMLRWNGAPLDENTELWIENAYSQAIGINRMTVVTPYGTYLISTTYQDSNNTPINLASTGSWTTLKQNMPFPTNDLKVGKVVVYKGQLSNRKLVWVESSLTDAGVSMSLEITDRAGVVLSTGGGAYQYAPGQKYRLMVTVAGNNPVQIRRVELTGTVTTADYSVDPPEFELIPITKPVISIEEISKGWAIDAEFRAAVPAGSQRIMRHPTMTSGTRVINQNGTPCTWESPLFLLLPDSTTTLYWSAGGGGTVSNPVPANYSIKTAVTWGQFEIRGKNHAVPEDIENNSGVRNSFNGIPVYTPTIQVSIGGADMTKDLVSAGGLSVSLFGEKGTAASAPTPGDDFIIGLDGHVIEWGKMVSFSASGVHNGIQIDIGAIDPLEYHNIDLDTLESGDIPNPYLDLPGFAGFIAQRAGLNFSLDGVNPPGDQTADTNEVYDVYGSTVTQELELVANISGGTLVSDPTTRSIKVVPFDGEGATNAKGSLCPFITEGFNLSQGYAVVEVAGISNTLKVTSKTTSVTFVNGGGVDTSIGILQDMGGNVINSDQTRWYPPEPVNGLDYIQFETINANKGVDVMPIPIRFALARERQITLEEQKQTLEYYKDGFYHWDSIGFPKLLNSFDMMYKWKVIAHINPSSWFGARNPDLKIGETGQGFFQMDRLLFKVESPATIRARLKLGEDELPDALGPCVVGFKAHMEDLGGTGMMIEFRLAFSGVVPDESRIGIKPFICPPTNAPDPNGLPNKKVTVQNPFLVQERPKEGEAAEEFDPEASPSYARGVSIASGLTRWEGMKRHQGEVKYLGGVSGSIGGKAEGMTIIENPRAIISPGEACWTVFKVSSYSG